MPVGATRHFESFHATIEWLLDEGDLTEEQRAALHITHNLLCDATEELWGERPPKLPEKTDSIPLSSEKDAEYYRENY